MEGPRQLFVLVHGICGDEKDWEVWRERLSALGRPSWEVRTSTSITPGSRFAGHEIQRLGHELALEVIKWISEYADHDIKVSVHFICHSLGGIIARVAMPKIIEFFSARPSISYGQFLTLNTPHLGVHAVNINPLLCWKNWGRILPDSLFKQIHQVTLQDGVDAELLRAAADGFKRCGPAPKLRPRLLDELASLEGRFVTSLRCFQNCTAVAATHWDVIVPFATAAICVHNPFPPPNILNGAFWRIDAALGFQEGSALYKKNAEAGRFAAELEESLQPGSRSEDGQREECSAERSVQSSGSWVIATDNQVTFPSSMLENLSQAVPWRRIAFTLHNPMRAGDVHIFTIGKYGKDKQVYRWSVDFIDLVLSIFTEEEPQHGRAESDVMPA